MPLKAAGAKEEGGGRNLKKSWKSAKSRNTLTWPECKDFDDDGRGKETHLQIEV